MFMRSPYVIPEIQNGQIDEDKLGGLSSTPAEAV